MSLKNSLGSLALAASLLGLGAGCVVRAHGRVGVPVARVEVYEEPPPPRVVVVDTRPGFVWVQGRWHHNGGRWVWYDGHWERERSGYVWEQGRWERSGRGHIWVEGRWRSGGGYNNGPTVRDHRDHRRGQPAQPARQPPPTVGPAGGPVIRDHRR